MFKSLELKKSALEKLPGDRGELLKGDIEGSMKSLPPGEWVLLRDPHRKRVYLAFANSLVDDKRTAVHVLKRLTQAPVADEAALFMRHQLHVAFRRRSLFEGYEGSRLVYGAADGLPGLVVDVYANGAVIQVNTAGMEKWRPLILEEVEKHTGRPGFFLDNPTQRGKEMLPHHQSQTMPALEIQENGFLYQVPREKLQKVGWYYDHRENRRRFEDTVKRWRGDKREGVDLFCYGGAWGMHALRAGVQKVDFIDQGSLAEMVEGNIAVNHFTGRGHFERADVFDWLDVAAAEGKRYGVVVSDPPAFAKSFKERTAALEGYRKLHRRILKITHPEALVATGSCTHYVSMEEFQESFAHAARLEGREVRLLDVGMQGWDHPVSSLGDRANYIKYALWALE